MSNLLDDCRSYENQEFEELQERYGDIERFCDVLVAHLLDVAPGCKEPFSDFRRMRSVIRELAPWAFGGLSDPSTCKELKSIFEKVVDLDAELRGDL